MSYGRIRRGPMAADQFTQIRNAVFRDARLTAKAMGIFGNISTHRDGWGITPESIASQMRDGVDAVKAGLRELERHGYLQRERERRPNGTLGASTYFITDQPEQMPSSEPKGDFPPQAKPPEEKPTVDDQPHKKTIPSQKISSVEKTTSPSPPEPTEPAAVADVTEGGGGGSDLRSTAEGIAASLDYLGHVPDKQQLERITTAILAALEAGWSARGLAVYLHLGTYRPDNPVAFYLSKLSPAKLPAAEPPPAGKPPATGHRPFACPPDSEYGGGFGAAGGTDATVAGWGEVARQLAAREQQGYQPFRNPIDQDVYDQPFWPDQPAPRPPWCGDPECNETDRTREVEDAQGFKYAQKCHRCHPDTARAA